MGDFTTYMADKVLAEVFNGVAPNYPTTFYVGLWTAPIDDNSDGSAPGEVPTGTTGYERVAIDVADWKPVLNGVVSNSTMLQFPMASENWGMLTHVGLLDSQTGGEMLAHTTLVPELMVSQTDIVLFRPNELVVTLS